MDSVPSSIKLTDSPKKAKNVKKVLVSDRASLCIRLSPTGNFFPLLIVTFTRISMTKLSTYFDRRIVIRDNAVFIFNAGRLYVYR